MRGFLSDCGVDYVLREPVEGSRREEAHGCQSRREGGRSFESERRGGR